MHHVKLRLVVLGLTAALFGLAVVLFSTFHSSSHNAEATTPVGPWKLIGTGVSLKKDVGHTVWDINMDQPLSGAKMALLTKGAHIIVRSNPPDVNNDYPPASWRIITFKKPLLALERVPNYHCTKPPPPGDPLPAPGHANVYVGPCDKPVVGGANETDLSGVSDIIVDGGNPAVDAYHCISRTDIAAGGADVKTAAQCNDNTGALSAGGAEPINSATGEGATGDAGAVGPPPPPPYTVSPPAKGRGTYAGDTLTVTTCFPDVGSSVNIIAVLTIPNAHAQLAATGKLVGSVVIYGPTVLGSAPQSNAACDSLTPAGAGSAPIGTTIYPAADIAACPAGNCVQSPYRSGAGLHGYPDWDQDGCTDSDELWQDKPGVVTKCGDDPWNPLDVPAGPTPDASGEYSLTAVALRQDVGAPGFYYYCDADINQSGKNLTARVLCYIDSPAAVVNPSAVPMPNTNALTCPPAPAAYCGDGISGAPPPGTTVGTYPTNPRIFTKIAIPPKGHTVLTGVVDNAQNVIKLSGCFNPGYPTIVGNVYVIAWINLHTGHGKVNLWINLSKPDCEGGIVVGPGDIIPVHAVRQAMKVADPFPAPGPSTGHDGDSDGCSDKRELVDTANRGGLRDPSNHYDYFNPTKDGLNRVDDILATVNNYFVDDPPGAPDMKSQTDRVAILGTNAWNLSAPNGQQRVDDILNSVKQYFHDC